MSSEKLYWVRVEIAADMLVLAENVNVAHRIAAGEACNALDGAGLCVDSARPLTDSQINACDPDELLWGYIGSLGEWLDERMVQGGMPEPVVLDHPDQGSLFS